MSRLERGVGAVTHRASAPIDDPVEAEGSGDTGDGARRRRLDGAGFLSIGAPATDRDLVTIHAGRPFHVRGPSVGE